MEDKELVPSTNRSYGVWCMHAMVPVEWSGRWSHPSSVVLASRVSVQAIRKEAT